ncbi:MAG: Holliday junction resolvase RuvX [Actinobacteria bacterium]|nr:Holliday junction resolvase RuvX [Actinomycetota bacterium]
MTVRRGRRIAFDFGSVRIGVAACDPDGIFASPVTTLQAGATDLWLQIDTLITDLEPIEIYVGKPIHLGGQSSDSTDAAVQFAQTLGEKFAIPVTLIDERLSTVSGARKLQEVGINAKKSKAVIDQVAAVGILEFALEIEAGLNKRGKNE